MGDPAKGLRIITMEWSGNRLKIIVEGLAGKLYNLGLLHDQHIESVIGAKLEGNGLLIQIPQGREGEFVRQEIVLKVKEL